MKQSIPKKSQPKFVFFSAILGNILEYYDFTVYSVFVPVIGRTFFPSDSELVQIMLSLAAFAVGFITRPVGGIVFGYIGDKYGRKIALIISVLGMTISTFAIGLIPSYLDIGIYAPMLLVTMRLVQGLCISGEGAGAAIFVLEHNQTLKPGLSAGIVNGSNIAGTLIASCIGIIIDQYFGNIDYAWRGAFLLGGSMGLIGLYLRMRVSETPIFKTLMKKKLIANTPFVQVARTSWRLMFLTFCVGAIASSMVYLVKAYVVVFYHNVLNLDRTVSLIYLSYSSFILMIAMPIFGWISDIIGKLRTLVLSSIAILFLVLPTIFLMSSTVMWQQILALTGLGILSGSVAGVAYIFVISLFTPENRFSGVAFSYNFGVAILGGTAPIISRWLIEKTGLFYAPAFYIITISILFLGILYIMRDVIEKALLKNSKLL